MLPAVFLRGNSVFPLESAVKTGIIRKTELLADLSDGLVPENRVLAGVQPFSCNILMG